MDQLGNAGNLYYTYVRNSYDYQDIEGVMKDSDGNEIKDSDDKTTLIAPTRVTATVEAGKATFQVESYQNAEGETCDPFRYEVRITVKNSDGSTTTYDGLYFYDETGSVSLPISTVDENVTFKVRAVSMYDDVNPSAYVTADVNVVTTILPEPEVKLELVWVNSLNAYQYRVSLDNIDKYETTALTGKWQVTVEVNNQTVTLNSSNKTGYLTGIGNTASYKMVSQASPLTADANGNAVTGLTASAQISEYVCLPNYHPYMGINAGDRQITPSVTVTGSTLEDLSVTVSLRDNGTSDLDITPVYRAELVGTWTNPKTGAQTTNVTFGYADILIVAKGTASAQLDLKTDYLQYGSDFQIRIWYASSGLGPVYTYYKWIDGENSTTKQSGATTSAYAAGTDQILSGMGADGNPTFGTTVASPILLDGEMGNYKYSRTAFILLDASVLEDTLTQSFNDKDELWYTIKWNQNVSFDVPSASNNKSYEVSLVGIVDDGTEVVIDTSSYYTDNKSNQLYINADDWNYKQIRVEVVMVDSDTTTQNSVECKQIGVSGTMTYDVKSRLEKPAQPIVSLIDSNELNYDISWTDISKNAGKCGSYEVYLTYTENGTTVKAPLAVVNVTRNADGTVASYSVANAKDDSGTAYTYTVEQSDAAWANGMFTLQSDLNEFAGKDVSIYVVAEPTEAASEQYTKSAAGISYDFTVPSRVPTPSVTWTYDWSYDTDTAVTMTEFEDTGLKVTLTPKKTTTTDSIPPAGAQYVLQAQIFDNETDAQNAASAVASTGKISTGIGEIATWPAAKDGTVTPEAMSGDSSAYYGYLEKLSAKYAGMYIVCYARISSGGGMISSDWVASEAKQLPRVQLDKAAVTTGSVDQELDVTLSANDESLTYENFAAVDQKTLTWTDTDVNLVDTISIVANVRKSVEDNDVASMTQVTFRMTKSSHDETSIANGTVPTLLLEQVIGSDYVTVFADTLSMDEVNEILTNDPTTKAEIEATLTAAGKTVTPDLIYQEYCATHFKWTLAEKRRPMLYASALALFTNGELYYYTESAETDKTTDGAGQQVTTFTESENAYTADNKTYAVKSTNPLAYFYEATATGGYYRTLTGDYTNGRTYSTTMIGELEAVWNRETKTFTYTMTLPDATALTLDNTVITNNNLFLTYNVLITNGTTNTAHYADSEQETVSLSNE